MKNSNAPVNTVTNERGFVSLFFLSTITLFSITILTAGFINFSFEAKTDFRYFCFHDLKKIQDQLLHGERTLFSLNPLARALRVRLRLLNIQLAAAVASENIPLVIQTQQLILQAKQQQRALDTQQKILIKSTERLAQFHLKMRLMDYIRKQRSRALVWSQILKVEENIFLNTRNPRMAVHGDQSGEPAPIYTFNPDFESEQLLSASWSLWFFAKESFQRLINSNQRWRFECRVSPLQKKTTLESVISADKL